MSYKNKTYIIFDGDNDIRHYRLMLAWKENQNFDFNFYDAHDLNTARDSSTEESIKSALRERMASAKQAIVLVGNNTKYLRMFVPWEIELARKKDIPILLVNLNGSRVYDSNLCPSCVKDNIYTMSVSFQPKIIKHTLDYFPSLYAEYKNKKDHTYSFNKSVYEKLGL